MYRVITWVYNIYCEMLQLISTFPHLHLYLNGHCFSYQFINTNFISSAPSPTFFNASYLLLFFCVCNSLSLFIAFWLWYRSAHYMGSSYPLNKLSSHLYQSLTAASAIMTMCDIRCNISQFISAMLYFPM